MGQAIFSLILVLLISSTKEIEAKPKRQISGENVPFRKQAFRFGYTIKDQRHGTQFRQEEGDHRGVVQGSYGYHDPFGIYRHVDYIADALGYRARIRSNEPGLGQQDPAHVEIVKTGVPHSISLHHRVGPVSNDHLVAISPASSNRNSIKVKDVLRPAESTRIVKPSDGLFESTRQTIKVRENVKKENDKNIISVLFSDKSQKTKKKKKYGSDIQTTPQVPFKKIKIKPVKQEVILEYPQHSPGKSQSIIQFSQQLPENVVKFPQNPSDNSQKGVEYSQNVSENPQNPLSYIQNNPEIQNTPEIVEVAVDRPVPIPYLVQNSGKQQPEIDIIQHPSDSNNKYSSNVYHFSNPENPQDGSVVMVEQFPDIQPQSSINHHHHQLEGKRVVEPQYQTEARVPVVIIKNQPNEPHADFASSMQETNKLPFVILKEVTSQDQISESTNNNIRSGSPFVFEKDLKTSQTVQKIQCPIACFTPSVINGEKERRYQPIPCFVIQQ
ncbi:uncharacterized protein [Centruroides vittatus]|uniref:uncharacterized protein n=1 Tax=Centruroides vittatus TaxID=120091 RepID=UPI00350FAE5D